MNRHDKQFIYLTGIPGAGKTTLAQSLAPALGRQLITMHSIVEQIDPEALARGDMADERAMRRAFQETMYLHRDDQCIIDGWPRSAGQAGLIDMAESMVILLTCREDVARDRLLRRGRADDTIELVDKRIRQQSRLLAVNEGPGWAYLLAGWENRINTTYRTRESVQTSVYRYLIGEKGQAFDG